MIRHSSRPAASLSVLLLLIVVYAPLPFAGALPRDHFLLDFLGFVAGAFALFFLPREAGAKASAPVIALGLLAAWALLQSVPLPNLALRWISPQAAALWQESHELTTLEIPQAGKNPKEGTGTATLSLGAISLAPSASRAAALHLLALAATLLAATLASQERSSRRLLLLALLLGAFFQVFYGASGFLAKSGAIWGVAVPGETSRLRGTFVNSDHFALYLALATILAGGLLWWACRQVWRDRNWEAAPLWVGAPLVAFSSFFVAAVFSGSRAGLLALVLGLGIQALALARHYGRWQVFAGGITAIVLGLVAVALVSWQQGFARLSQTSVFELTWNDRLQVYGATLDLFGRFPVFGCGLGSFRYAFPLVQPNQLTTTWEHAHNDYLELLATGGPLALLVMAWGVWHLGKGLWRAFHLGRRSEDRAMGLIAIGALATTATHAFFDFGLAMPANSFTLAVLCGLALGVGQERITKTNSGLTVFLPPEDPSQPIPRPSNSATREGVGG